VLKLERWCNTFQHLKVNLFFVLDDSVVANLEVSPRKITLELDESTNILSFSQLNRFRKKIVEIIFVL